MSDLGQLFFGDHWFIPNKWHLVVKSDKNTEGNRGGIAGKWQMASGEEGNGVGTREPASMWRGIDGARRLEDEGKSKEMKQKASWLINSSPCRGHSRLTSPAVGPSVGVSVAVRAQTTFCAVLLLFSSSCSSVLDRLASLRANLRLLAHQMQERW